MLVKALIGIREARTFRGGLALAHYWAALDHRAGCIARAAQKKNHSLGDQLRLDRAHTRVAAAAVTCCAQGVRIPNSRPDRLFRRR